MSRSPTPQQPTSTAVQVVQPAQAPAVLDDWPADRYNRLIPTSVVLGAVNPLMVPVVHAVALDPERDTYRTNDMPAGHKAMTKTALLKLANVAGISVVDQYRDPNAERTPDQVAYTTKVAMTLPTGTVITAIGSKVEDAARQNFASPAHRAKYLARQPEFAATKSQLRAIRALLTLPASMPERELLRPWAVVHYVPNMADPDVRGRMLDAMGQAADRAFGRPALTRGEAELKMIAAPEVADDDPPAQAGGTVTNADGQTVDVATGEVVADQAGTMFDAPASTVPLLDRLATRARLLLEQRELDGIPTNAPATDRQKLALQGVLGPIGVDDTAAVVLKAFGLEALNQIQVAHAAAILDASAQDGFQDDWRQAAAKARA